MLVLLTRFLCFLPIPVQMQSLTIWPTNMISWRKQNYFTRWLILLNSYKFAQTQSYILERFAIIRSFSKTTSDIRIRASVLFFVAILWNSYDFLWDQVGPTLSLWFNYNKTHPTKTNKCILIIHFSVQNRKKTCTNVPVPLVDTTNERCSIRGYAEM